MFVRIEICAFMHDMRSTLKKEKKQKNIKAACALCHVYELRLEA